MLAARPGPVLGPRVVLLRLDQASLVCSLGAGTLRVADASVVPGHEVVGQLEVGDGVIFGVSVVGGAVRRDGSQLLVASTVDDRTLLEAASRLAWLLLGRALATFPFSALPPPVVLPFPSPEVSHVP